MKASLRATLERGNLSGRHVFGSEASAKSCQLELISVRLIKSLSG